jgi:hypothetical protein
LKYSVKLLGSEGNAVDAFLTSFRLRFVPALFSASEWIEGSGGQAKVKGGAEDADMRLKRSGAYRRAEKITERLHV